MVSASVSGLKSRKSHQNNICWAGANDVQDATNVVSKGYILWMLSNVRKMLSLSQWTWDTKLKPHNCHFIFHQYSYEGFECPLLWRRH